MPSRGAKAAIDWEAAFAFYVALPAPERSYQTVADQFSVSVRTVETHGREERWKERLRAINEQAAARVADAMTEARVEEIARMRRLIEASLIAYAERLRDGMRMTPADLERLNRLSLALIDEATHPQPQRERDDAVASQRDPAHAAAVLDALAETGALEALGLTRLPPPDTTDSTPEIEETDDAEPN